MRVHHLNCLTMRPPGGRLVDGKGTPLRTARLVAHVLLIETEQGLVLVDTGIGRADVADPKSRLGQPFLGLVRPALDPAETAHAQLTALGFDPADVRHIVLTHLDVDHAGGLADFPNAVVHAHADEVAAMRSPGTALERRRYRQAQFAHDPKFTGYDTVGEPWFGFDAIRKLDGLPEELLLVPLAGHTRGHCGVAVDTGAGWLLHAGDAYFFHGEADPHRTSHTLGLTVFQRALAHDDKARLTNQERLRELVRDHSAEIEVFSAHDAAEFDRYA